jgi:hypothetical protein
LVGGKEKIMFISYAEKKFLQSELKGAFQAISLLSADITMLKAKIKVLEGEKGAPKKQTTAAQRAKQREYMRKYKARKKAEKAAQIAQAVA